jgi:hypothetical protein
VTGDRRPLSLAIRRMWVVYIVKSLDGETAEAHGNSKSNEIRRTPEILIETINGSLIKSYECGGQMPHFGSNYIAVLGKCLEKLDASINTVGVDDRPVCVESHVPLAIPSARNTRILYQLALWLL